MNCYFPMPFSKGAKLTLENQGTKPIRALYFNINYARPGYLTFATHALDGPAGRCAPTQNPCTAYNYGWNAAADAVDRGDAAGADPAMWWLDGPRRRKPSACRATAVP